MGGKFVIGMGALLALVAVVAGAYFVLREDDSEPTAALAPFVSEESLDDPFAPEQIEYESVSPEKAEAAREEVTSEFVKAQELEAEAEIEPGPNGIMPASAGDNGTYDKPPKHLQRTTYATMAGKDGFTPENSAILLGKTAIAPDGAPPEVEQAISAANAIVGTPYVWGGGHGSWNDTGYDCSGAVSYALGGAGLLGAPVNSTGLMSWGKPGPGKWITVYANDRHTYAVIAGLRWDTVGQQRGSGPKWHAESPYPAGYTVRHPAGL